MECFNPIKLDLTKDCYAKTRAYRASCSYMPVEWRYATQIYVPCGKCAACLSRRRSQWSFRLFQEVRSSDTCYFVTLTYEDEHIPYVSDPDVGMLQTVSKKDVQLFLKRLRKKIQPFKIRYFLVSEYGPKTYRPHYHMLMFNFPYELRYKLDEYLTDSWQNGFIRVDPVTDAHVNYVTSYCLDSSTLPPKFTKNFMLCSRRPGIGSSYLDNDSVRRYHVVNMDDFGYVPNSGKVTKVKLPRYLVDKLLSDEQRNKINLASMQFHDEVRVERLRKQRQWLESHGYEVNEVTLKSPFFGSPEYDLLCQRDEFTEKVKRKCKMKKNG